jgi:UDP-N-acetylglucosamine 3-dehydrogenase
MDRILRAAVIGAGSMGLNHIRVYADLEDVELVAVADVSPTALARLSRKYRIPVYTDYREMIAKERIDLVSVVVPTADHCSIASETLNNRLATLIEKPIAQTVEEGAQLIELAERTGTMLTVGHIERFNPAVRALKAELERGTLGTIYQMFARRIGPFPSRIQDVGVVIDLATHDLDVMRFLSGASVTNVSAELSRRLHTSHEDMLSAVLRFDNDVVGVLDINWLAPTKVRELSVIGEAGMFVVNYLTQDLSFYENASRQGDWPELAVLGVTEGRAIRLPIVRTEPLRAELVAFIQAVRNATSAPVCPHDALEALSIAYRLIDTQHHSPNGLGREGEARHGR